MFEKRLENKITNKNNKIKKLEFKVSELKAKSNQYKDSLQKNQEDLEVDSMIEINGNIANIELLIRELQNTIKRLAEEPAFELSEVQEAWEVRLRELSKILIKNNDKVEAAYKNYMRILKESKTLSVEISQEEDEWKSKIAKEFNSAKNNQIEWTPLGVSNNDIFRNNAGKFSKYLNISLHQISKYEER